MFENPRRGRQPKNFPTNVPKILDLKSSSEQIFWIFSENCRWVSPFHRDFSNWTRLLCQMEVNSSEVEFLRTLSKFRKRKKPSSLLIYVLYKTRNLAFSRCGLAVTGWQRNVQKPLRQVQCFSYSKYRYILTFSLLWPSWHLKRSDIYPAQETSPCKNVTTR